MHANVLEIENILNKEIDIFSKLEKHMLDKKNYLIKSDIEGLRNTDIEIEKLRVVIVDLESKKTEVLNKSGKKATLTSFLDEINDKSKAKEISLLKEKIVNKALNIQKQNNINKQLIQHSLKLIEQTVMLISDAIMPESSAYNNCGQIKKKQVQEGMSSIVQEA